MKSLKKLNQESHMTNYSIDGSVYAYPFQEGILNIEDLYKYCKTIRDLHDVIIEKQPRNKKYYLFLRDMISIFKNDELNFINKDIELFRDIIRENPKKQFLIKEAQKLLNEIYERLLPTDIKNSENNDSENDAKKGNLNRYVIFENWFNIKNIIFLQGHEPMLPDYILKEIKNKDLRKNLRKNMAIIAALNKYVYKNNEIHKVVLNNNCPSDNFNVTAEFDIKMEQVSYLDKNDKPKNYVYKIKELPLKNAIITNQNVHIFNLESFIKINMYDSWEKAYSDAETNFKDHLIFGPECKIGICCYVKKILEKREKYGSSERLIIDKWLNEFPDTLYENLKALKNFIAKIDLTMTGAVNPDERYHCHNACNFYCSCCSYIRFFGVDCVDELPYHKGLTNRNGEYLDIEEVEKIKQDRTKTNSIGEKSEYWLHLRPKTVKQDNFLSFLTLRIHFRRFAPQKLEIGWIGGHLYLPKIDLS